MICPRVGLLVSMLLVVAVLCGCAAPAPGTSIAASGATPTETPSTDRAVTLPSGATLKVPIDWTVTAAPDGVVLRDPEKQLRIDLVEVDATGGMREAIPTAWSRRHPGFDRPELAASDSPGREG